MKLNFQNGTLRICVDCIEQTQISGRITGQRLRVPMRFSDVNELMIQIDLLLDAQKFPQAFQRARSFSNKPMEYTVPAALLPEEMLSAEEVDSAHGEITTFLLNVVSRQHSSWQGYMDWLDGTPQQPFKSTLEFLKAFENKLSAIMN